MSGTQQSLQRSVNKFLRKKGVIEGDTIVQVGSLVTLDLTEAYPSSEKEYAGFVSGFAKGSKGAAVLVSFNQASTHRFFNNRHSYDDGPFGYRAKKQPYKETYQVLVDWMYIVKVENGPYDIETMLTSSNLKIREIAKTLYAQKENDDS